IAVDADRKDLQTIAAQALAQSHIIRLELDEAERLLTRALELSGESGSVRARIGTTITYGTFLMFKGELDAAETVLEAVRTTAGTVRAAQGRREEAVELLRSSLALAHETGNRFLELGPLKLLGELMREQGLDDEAEVYEERLAELAPSEAAALVV